MVFGEKLIYGKSIKKLHFQSKHKLIGVIKWLDVKTSKTLNDCVQCLF